MEGWRKNRRADHVQCSVISGKHKLFSACLALIMLALCLFSTPAFAANKVLKISAKTTRIGDRAFYGNKAIVEVSLPEGLKTIGSKAFAGCTGLTTINLPDSLTSIADDAFEGCTKLVHLTATKGKVGYKWGRSHGYFPEYKALVIGEKTFLRYETTYEGYRYYKETANRNVSDATNMKNMLTRVVGPSGGAYAVHEKTNLTAAGIKAQLDAIFANNLAQDVSLFFIASHGNSNGDGELEMAFTGNVNSSADRSEHWNNDTLSFSTLASWLRDIPGEWIVILESCGSGSAVYSTAAEQNASGVSSNPSTFDPERFVTKAVTAFAAQDGGVAKYHSDGTLAPNVGELRVQNKFYVLAASRHHELSWGIEGKTSYNYFTQWLVDGVGKKGNSPADTSKDGVITLKELFAYIKKVGDKYPMEVWDQDSYSYRTYYQHVQHYPKGSAYALFRFP